MVLVCATAENNSKKENNVVKYFSVFTADSLGNLKSKFQVMIA
jgi:hypothetical protein